MTITTYRVPKHFIQDHDGRGCLRAAIVDGAEYGEIIGLEDVLVKETKSHFYVALTDEQAQELMSDADYYRDGGGGGMDWSECGAIISSARATYNALIKQGVVWTPMNISAASVYYGGSND